MSGPVLPAPPREQIDRRVQVIVAACGLASGAALVVAIVADRPLWLTSSFILVPGLVAFVGLTVAARRDQQLLFLTRLRVGLLAGVLATLAYDVSRWTVETLHWSSTDSFVGMPIFGAGLTGLESTHGAAMVAGWGFHLLNGLGFAIAYVLIAAGRRWWWGIVYGLVLEAFMVSLYPDWLGIQLSSEFLSVSVLGHVCYGATLGLFAERTP